MEKTTQTQPDGTETGTNWMLDEVIDTCAENECYISDETIKKLAIQKIEYGDKCLSQILVQIKANFNKDEMIQRIEKLQSQLHERITELKTI